jgi:hypothetical protein
MSYCPCKEGIFTMKMILRIIASGVLFSSISMAMDDSKTKKLTAIKESSSKMRKFSIFGITLGLVPQESKPMNSKDHPKHPASNAKKQEKEKKQQSFDEFKMEQNRMSECLKDSNRKNLKYAIIGNSMLDA